MNDIDSLIRKAEGGTHSPAKYSKRGLGLFRRRPIEPERWEFGLEEQLDAIRALGSTRDARALTYLRNLYSFEVGRRSEEIGRTGTHDRWNVYEYRAKGPLQQALRFELRTAWVVSCSTGDYQDGEDEDDIEDRRKGYVARSETHQAILKAVDDLRVALETRPA